MNIEDTLKGKGYKLSEEQGPFRIYEKHRKRIIYHTPSGEVWGSFIINKKPFRRTYHNTKDL